VPPAPGRGASGAAESDGVAWERLMLLRAVREVAVLASPGRPEAVTQRAFDAARAGSSAHGWLPSARQIAEQLKLSWPETLAAAREPEDRQPHKLGAASRGPTSVDWLTEEHAAAVLQLVARRLSANTVSAAEYEAQCAQLLRTDRARWFHGGNLLLPTPRQLVHRFGSWDEALRKAGLKLPYERAPRPRPRPAPSFPDLMERFHDEYAVQPTAKALQEFARGNGIPYPDPRRVKFSDGLREWLEQRRANGEPSPRVIHRRPGRVPGNRRPAPRPDYSRDVNAARPGERRLGGHRQIKWTREDCIASVARYLEDTAGSRSTQRGYSSWAAAQESVPHRSTLELHGGWEAMRKLAQKELHRRAASG
jgi:hypothetical protein